MVHELQRVLPVCDGFFSSMSAINDGVVRCGSGSTNRQFSCASYFDRKPISDFKCVAILDEFGRRKITRAA